MNIQQEYEVQEEEEQTSGVLEFLAESDLYSMLIEMGNNRIEIDAYQKRRLVQTVLVFLLGILIALFTVWWVGIIGLGLAFVLFKKKYSTIKGMHGVWKFNRHLQFSKFTRLLIPYLKQSQGKVSLYMIFNKILQRTEVEEDRTSLYQLMTEMTDRPNDIQPFVDFANRSSGTDMSVLFMSTVYDFQQSSHDTAVIDELGKIASDELMKGVDEIIEFKLRRFVFFPTKVVMTSFVLVLGFAVGVVLHNVAQINFLGGF